MTQHLLNIPSAISLVKQLFDYLLFNPGLWISTAVKVQMDLYTYLATEFVANAAIYGNIRRTSTVIQTMHALKHHYFVVNPTNRSGIEVKSDGKRDLRATYTYRKFVGLAEPNLLRTRTVKSDGELCADQI